MPEVSFINQLRSWMETLPRHSPDHSPRNRISAGTICRTRQGRRALQFMMPTPTTALFLKRLNQLLPFRKLSV
jgi:hypothetical protein